MPIRSMLYDALNYSEQVSIISKENRKYKKLHGSAEFLSGFRKADKVSPAITLVFYYGSQEWDGSQDVCGLIDLEGAEMEETDVELLKKYIPNYKMNLIQAVHLAENNSFKTDLQWMMGMLRYKENKTELIQYMKDHVDFFGNINKDEFGAVKVLLGSKNIPKVLSQTEENRGIDMCRALDEWYQDGVNEGIGQGEDRFRRLSPTLFSLRPVLKKGGTIK